MENDGESKNIGIGDIVLIISLRYNLVLKNVQYVPDICMNLLLMGVLDEEDYYSVFRDSKWKLTKKSLVAAKGIKQNSLYFMQAKFGKGEVNAVEKSSASKL